MIKIKTTLILVCLFFSTSLVAGDFEMQPAGSNQRIDVRQLGHSPAKFTPQPVLVTQTEEDDDDDFDDDLEGEFEEAEANKKADPFEGYNVVMTDFNDKVYTYALDPVARGYRWILPEAPRRGVVNFFKNIWFPIRFVNNLLQAKVINAGEETARFVINSTIGIFGFFDPAKHWFDLEAHPEDFGQTLGVWGVGAGPHIVLPFLGPSNLRDALAWAPDYYMDPITYVKPNAASWGLVIYESVNDTSLHIGEYENLKKDALELYPFLRDAYEQNRIKKIKE